MFCPNCGKQIGNNQRFCQYCGTKLSLQKPSATHNPNQTPVSAQQPVPNTAPQHVQPASGSYFDKLSATEAPASFPGMTPAPIPSQQIHNPRARTPIAPPTNPQKERPEEKKARIEAQNKQLYNDVLNRMRYYSSVQHYLDADEFFVDRDA